MDKLKKSSRFHQTFHDFPPTRKVAAEKQMLSKKGYKDIEVGRVSKLTILSLGCSSICRKLVKRVQKPRFDPQHLINGKCDTHLKFKD